jgi:hypothetical protein
MEKIKWVLNTMPKSDKEKSIEILTEKEVNKAKKFHKSFPQYSETPLVSLNNLAKELGVSGIYVKDESYRFGLNAFKVLGGSYAMAKYLAEKLGKDISELPYEKLISEEIKKELGDITFYTATDGNHGRGIAWTASKLKQKSVVYMPKGSSKIRLDNILAEGADASITELNYDDAVRLAAKNAEKNNGVMVQDTAWEGYVDIPVWIMQGYGTMALEAKEQLEKQGVDRPTHIFVQAGVGSLAGAILGFFASVYKENVPITIVVEPNLADCYYRSAVQGDGKPVNVEGDMATLMAGLACGEPNIIGFEILKNYAIAFLSCPDYIAAKGMRISAAPLKGDRSIISGESGAVPLGSLFTILKDDCYKELRKELKLDENSKILIFNTEGNTDPTKYIDIVWDGEYKSK